MPLKTPMPYSFFSLRPFVAFVILLLAILVLQNRPIKLAESELFWKICLWLEFFLLVGHSGLYVHLNSVHLNGIMSNKQLFINNMVIGGHISRNYIYIFPNLDYVFSTNYVVFNFIWIISGIAMVGCIY